jgi:hypothetical protein
MTGEARKNRILELIIDKVFGDTNEAAGKELNDLLNHPEEDRSYWENLMVPEKLIDFISNNYNDGSIIKLDAAKAKFIELTNKGRSME